MISLVWVAAAGVVLGLVGHWVLVRRWRRLHAACPVSPSLWQLGNLRPLFGEGVLAFYQRVAKASGARNAVVWAGVSPHVIVAEPDSARRVLFEAETFERDPRPTEALFGRGLLRLDGEAWLERRRLFQPVFSTEALARAPAVIHEALEALVARWQRADQPFSPVRDVSFLMLTIVGRFLFGFEFDQARHAGADFRQALVAVSTDSVLRHYLPSPVVRLLQGRRVARAQRVLGALCAEVYAYGGPTAFMTTLRSAVADGTLSYETALDELRTFLIAGHETSATALNWALALVAERPELQAALRAESPEGAAADTLVSRVLQESMRLYPPVPLSIYRTRTATQLGQLEVPAGAQIDLCSYVLHRHAEAHAAPEQFEPARFAGPPPQPYLPFLLGRHTCLGMKLAQLELRLSLARLVHAFDFEIVRPPRPGLRLSLHPTGLLLKARPRAPGGARAAGA